MYEQFTEPCRQLMRNANEEAIGIQSRYISSGHLLLALASFDSDPMAELLRSFGVTPEQTRAEVIRLLKAEKAVQPESPQMKRVVEYMMEVARRFSHDHVGTEHLLLGLLHDRNDLAARALEAMGIDIDGLRDQVLARMTPASAEAIRHKIAIEGRLSDHPEVRRLKQQIEELQHSLHEAAKAKDVERAASCQHQIFAVRKELEQFFANMGKGGEHRTGDKI